MMKHQPYDGVKFSCADFASLMHTTTRAAWLTDNVIDFVSKMINNHPDSNRCLIFTTHLYDKVLVDNKDAREWVLALLNSKFVLTIDSLLVEKLLVPINLKRNHWVLVAIFIRSGKVFIIDPYCPPKPNADFVSKVIVFIDWLQSIIKPIRSIRFEVGCVPPFQLPQQPKTDSSNCGMYVIVYLMMLATETFQMQFDVPTYRGKLANWIMTKKMPLKEF